MLTLTNPKSHASMLRVQREQRGNCALAMPAHSKGLGNRTPNRVQGDRLPKYKAIKVKINGITFDSKAERSYYLELLKLQKSNLIESFELQPKIRLTLSEILYKPDFKVTYKNGKVEYVDVKGFQTPVFKLKKKLWKNYGLGTLVLVELKGSRFVEIERIETVGIE